MRHNRVWIVAVAALLGAVAIGVIAASFVFPSDQPKPAASPGETAIKIDPAPSPVAAMPPVESPPPIALPRHATPNPKPSASAPNSDPVTVTVTTINSW